MKVAWIVKNGCFHRGERCESRSMMGQRACLLVVGSKTGQCVKEVCADGLGHEHTLPKSINMKADRYSALVGWSAKVHLKRLHDRKIVIQRRELVLLGISAKEKGKKTTLRIILPIRISVVVV